MPSPDAGSGGDGEQENEGHPGNRNQANKLSRTHAALLDALDRHRGKGQQKVTVAGPSPVGIATIKSDSCQRLTVRISMIHACIDATTTLRSSMHWA
jgi:hypothetical protein